MAEYWFRQSETAEVQGPCTAAQLRALAARQIITPASLISTDQQRWHVASSVRGLFDRQPDGVTVEGSQDVYRLAPAPPPVTGPEPIRAAIPVHRLVMQPMSPVPVEPAVSAAPALIWPIVILLPAACGLLLVTARSVVAKVWAGQPAPYVLFGWAGIVSCVSLFMLLGTCLRHPLAQRAGVVLMPVAAGITGCVGLVAFSAMTNEAWYALLTVVVLAAVTPVLWTRPGAKQYFGLSCPECNSVRVGPESFTYSERRCAHCGTVFAADGTVIRLGARAPGAVEAGIAMASPPAGVGVLAGTAGVGDPTYAAASPSAAWEGVGGYSDAMAGVTYARAGAAAYAGTPGRQRDVTWVIVVSSIVLVLGVLNLGMVFASAAQPSRVSRYGAGPTMSPLAVGTQVVNCLTVAAALGVAVYWLVWVYKVHAEMRAYTGGTYPISPGKALGYSFIPFYNLYWCVYMPYQLARHVQNYLHARPEIVSPTNVLTYQILAIVPGSCVQGLQLLFYGLAMRSIQNGPNELWTQTTRGTVQYAM